MYVKYPTTTMLFITVSHAKDDKKKNNKKNQSTIKLL